jgi:hypothetical protein
MPDTKQAVDVPERYSVLQGTYDPPQREDARYASLSDQALEARTFNGFTRVVRRVTLSGVALVIDEGDSTGLLKATRRADDVAELFIVADSVTIKTAITVPGGRVGIYAREIRFVGADAYVETTGPANLFRDPAKGIDGYDGLPAGPVDIVCQTFTPDPSGGVHLRAAGGPGQEGEDGGLMPGTGTRHDVPPLTQGEWDELMSPSNRRVPHTKGWTEGTIAYISFDEVQKTAQTLHGAVITYADITNRAYKHVNTWQTDDWTVAQAGSQTLPGQGAAGAPPGRPGNGGNGGRVRTSVELPAGRAICTGGPSGPRHPPSPGQIGGTPKEAAWVHILGRPDRVNTSEHHTVTSVSVAPPAAEPGPDSAEGPPAYAPTGDHGAIERLRGPAADGWVNALSLAAVARFAEDAVSANNWEVASVILKPYAEVLSIGNTGEPSGEALKGLITATPGALGDEAATRLAADRVGRLVAAADSFLDEWGNPLGWVPSVTLESAVGVYENVLDGALSQLTLTYELEDAWRAAEKNAENLDAAITSLAKSVEQARKELVAARRELVSRTDGKDSPLTAMASLLEQCQQKQTALEKRRVELIRQADEEQMDADQRQAIADGFKLAGAMLKSIPLPEPYQTAAGAFGTLSETTSSLIETGGSVEAFDSLKDQVTKFADRKDLSDVFTRDITDAIGENDQRAKDLVAQAKTAAGQKAALKADRTRQIEALGKKQIAGREWSVKLAAQREALRFKPGTPSAVQEAQAALEKATQDATAADEAERKAAEALETKQKELSQAKSELEKQKSDRAENVKAALGKVKNLAEGAADIAHTISKMQAYAGSLDSRWAATVAKIQKHDAEFRELSRDLDYLSARKAEVAATILTLQNRMAAATDEIEQGSYALVELRTQYANSTDVLDPQALAYIQTMQQDAFKALSQFLYYVVKAYEYYTVKPWEDSQYAQVVRVYERLKELRTGESVAAFDAEDLKPVFEAPLIAMGRSLAQSLITGSGRLQVPAPAHFRLGQRVLDAINHSVADPGAPPVIVRPAALGWVDRGAERQRLRRIEVIAAAGRPTQPDLFPDEVSFTFIHRGKSIVRANGRLYAFDPSDGSPDRPLGSGVVWETTGTGAWRARGDGSSEIVRPTDPKPGEGLKFTGQDEAGNLISMLLGDSKSGTKATDAVTALSSYRPGAFSDLELIVEFFPSNATIQFTELVVEVTQEQVKVPEEALVSVRNDADLLIPVSFSRPDLGQITAGEGLVFVIYDQKDLRARKLTITFPEKFGTRRLNGATLLGQSAPLDVQKGALTVSGPCDVVAQYIETVESG